MQEVGVLGLTEASLWQSSSQLLSKNSATSAAMASSCAALLAASIAACSRRSLSSLSIWSDSTANCLSLLVLHFFSFLDKASGDEGLKGDFCCLPAMLITLFRFVGLRGWDAEDLT